MSDKVEKLFEGISHYYFAKVTAPRYLSEKDKKIHRFLQNKQSEFTHTLS